MIPFRRLCAGLICLTAAAVAAAQPQVWPMEGQDRWGTFQAKVGTSPTNFSTPWIFRKVAGYGIVSHGPAIDQRDQAYFNTWTSNLLVKASTADFAPTGTFNYLNWGQSTPGLSASGAAVFVHALKPFQNSGPSRLYRVNTTTMTEDWFFETSVEKINDYESASPKVGPEGDVMFGSRNGMAWRLNKYTGRPVWSRQLIGEIRRTIVFTRDDLSVVVAHGSQITLLSYASGATIWVKSLGSTAGAPGVAPDGTIVVGNEAGVVYGLNPATGGTKWAKTTLAKVVAAPAFSTTGDVYIAGYDHRVRAYKTANGAAVWTFTGSHENVAPPAVDLAGRIFFHNRIGDFYCLAPNGTQLWKVNTIGGARAPMSIGEDSSIYLGTNQGSADLMIIRTQGLNIQFSSLAMSAGALSGGGIGAMHKSDNVYASIRTGSFTSNVQMDLTATSPTYKNLASFMLRLETQNTAGPDATQEVYAWNNATSQYDLVSSTAATFGDSTVDVTVNTNTNNYVNQTSGEIKIRLRWFTAGAPGWSGKVDMARLISVVPAWQP